MKPWSSLPPNMSTTARGLSSSITSRTCVNQLKTSGRSSPLAMRPSIAVRRRRSRGCPRPSRRSDSPGTIDERVARDPDAELPLRRELHALRPVSSGVDHRRRRLRLGRRDGGVDLVVVRTSERRLERRARPVEQKSAAHALERPGDAERDVALPALGLDRRRLVQPRRVQEAARSTSPTSETTIADPAECSRRPPSAVRGRGRRLGVSRVSIRTGSR